MHDIKVFDTIYDEKLQKDWLFLQEGEDMTAFQHYEWYCMLEEEFKSNTMKKLFGKIQYFEVLEDDSPVLIAPMHIQKRSLKFKSFGYEKGIYFLGMRGYSDYLNLVYQSLNSQQLEFLFSYFKRVYFKYKIFLSEVRQCTLLSQFLNKGINGYNIINSNDEICVSLLLPNSTEAFFKGMSKQFRQNYRTQKHRCENDGVELKYKLHLGCLNDLSLLDSIANIHRDRFEHKNQDNNAVKLSSALSKIRGSFSEINFSMQNNHDSWLLLGYINGEVVSYIYGLQDHNAVRIMQLGFLKEYSKYSPGITILIDYLLENYELYSNKTIDFTRGDEPYKFRMGGTEHTIKTFSITKE